MFVGISTSIQLYQEASACTSI